ncbi:MAG: sulfatase-like hydrolase/transferase [Phycisphaerales bacterium]|nr:MAG: sulfatase-like hydrolase/transferase [Phycisphaerales bacterium]
MNRVSSPINRRDFLKLTAAGAVALALPGCTGVAQRSLPKPPKHPNVLFMAIDDLNDWAGCLGGHPDVKTPNLDKLASRGELFTNAHCSAPACNPSRASLMTGILPSTSGVYHNADPWRKSPALKNAVTIPQHFMAHGYSAVGGGKIYHGAFPDPPSWHSYFPSQKQNKPPDPMPPNRPINGIPKTAHFDWGPVDVPDNEMGDRKVAAWATGQLQKKHDKPFFIGCGFFRPHLPWYVPNKYFDMYPLDKITLPNVNDDDLDDVPELGKRMAKPQGDHAKVIKYKQWRKAVQGYLASITFVDTCVGRVIDALDNSVYADNTIIILWSDHGWHLGEKLHWRKFSLWEEATHNVLMAVVPGLTRPHQRCSRPVSMIDIYPTLIELCGLTPKKELEGRSLLPLLKNPVAKWDRPALTTHGRNNHSLRGERFRYIRYSDGTEELYDHDKDALEWTNLANDPKYAAVKKAFAKWLPTDNAPQVPKPRAKKKNKK